MTSRELTDAIDRLIELRITITHEIDHGYEDAEIAATGDKIKVLKEEIADALKRLDHNPGVYYGEPPIK